ncbi:MULTISPECIES: thermonuclease family protein [Sphingobacterium]|uniref:thermonuclease family protein n=1 Tax=Sphingobacterium TaxID=28453 RepID=UPI0010EB2B7C|nr:MULTISPECIES: thermonuclease family protein [Sphingobacterium]MCW2260129.1 micrococcal nuclease [Sphingobacterium kitahiroshimense]TCR11080.1 micrococcal nuclease [Sphingobacterium sp. JUb78]
MKNTYRKWSLLFSSLLLISSPITGCHSKSKDHKQKMLGFSDNGITDSKIASDIYLVTKVSDGDTFWCKNDREQRIKIRLIGIDAPEPRNYFRMKEQAFGKEASQYAKNLLLNEKVRLEFDVDSLDQFGRTLAYAYLLDNTFVNEKIIKDGYAVLMTIAPNVKYEKRFFEGQKYARENKLGLWAKPITE